MLAVEFSELNLISLMFIVCVVVGYGPSERDVEERDRFWNDMDSILHRVGNGYKRMDGR